MKNIRIEKTDSSYIVIADTEQFGKDAILFEGISEAECRQYIIRGMLLIARYSHSRSEIDEAVRVILLNIGIEKQKQIAAQCYRNFCYTSDGVLDGYAFYFGERGAYLSMKGCQCGLKIYINDYGEVTRKPRSEKIRVPMYESMQGQIDRETFAEIKKMVSEAA